MPACQRSRSNKVRVAAHRIIFQLAQYQFEFHDRLRFEESPPAQARSEKIERQFALPLVHLFERQPFSRARDEVKVVAFLVGKVEDGLRWSSFSGRDPLVTFLLFLDFDFSLELFRAFVAQGRVPPHPVVIAFDVAEGFASGLAHRLERATL